MTPPPTRGLRVLTALKARPLQGPQSHHSGTLGHLGPFSQTPSSDVLRVHRGGRGGWTEQGCPCLRAREAWTNTARLEKALLFQGPAHGRLDRRCEGGEQAGHGTLSPTGSSLSAPASLPSPPPPLPSPSHLLSHTPSSRAGRVTMPLRPLGEVGTFMRASFLPSSRPTRVKVGAPRGNKRWEVRASFLGALGPARSPLTHLEARPGTWHPPASLHTGDGQEYGFPSVEVRQSRRAEVRYAAATPAPQGRERCDCPLAGPHSHHRWPSRGQGEGHQQTDLPGGSLLALTELQLGTPPPPPQSSDHPSGQLGPSPLDLHHLTLSSGLCPQPRPLPTQLLEDGTKVSPADLRGGRPQVQSTPPKPQPTMRWPPGSVDSLGN